MNSADLAAHERADLAQATSAADAARRILARRRINIPDYIAEQVADAVLGYSGNMMSVRESIPRHLWQHPDIQEHALQRLRHQLLDEITSQGLLPSALPSHALVYQSWRYGSDQPLRASETEPAEWDTVEITLTAPVRVPPVDRKAAVKAGVLGGGG